MRAPVSWLRELCDPGWSTEELAERLALSGTDVQRIETTGPGSTANMVVGSVLDVQPHPDADRLRVCTVDTGDESPRTIVCGAPNVAAGQLVPVALPGAELPGGLKIAKAKLRGVESEGMICSEAELGLGEGSEGILVLDGDLEAGALLGEAIGLDEQVLELDITPNRVDCLGMWGIAREVHALSGAALADEPWADEVGAEGEGRVDDLASVRVDVPDLCPRFTARVFTDVRVGPSPRWLRRRLQAAGQRPISNVVDITNYVMLLTAQPLHAFDLDKVPGGELIVRAAAQGESMTTLDGVERSLDPEMVLVCDRNGPAGIAGIMGGQVSEVSDATTRVLLEVATWNGTNILRTSSRLGLRSDASTRFEKQLHPEMAIRAQAIASRLMVEVCGATLVPGTIDVSEGEPETRRVPLRSSRTESLLGTAIAEDEQVAYLERLGFGVSLVPGEPGALEVAVPPERDGDVTREADLIEEVVRIHGFDKLPSTLPSGGRAGGLTREQSLRRRSEDAMASLGFQEVVTWSFTDPALADRLRLPADDPRRAAVAIHNPLSEVGSVLRTTLLGGLLDAARHNTSRGAHGVRLFESGRVYLGTGESTFPGNVPSPLHEPHRLGALIAGRAAAGWRDEDRPTDFFTAKGVLEALCSGLGTDAEISPGAQPFLHPGRSAMVRIGGEDAGWIGEVHPLVARDWDLDGAVAFELAVDVLLSASKAGQEQYEDVTSFPAVLEDLAVIVPEERSAEEVRQAILAAGGKDLASVELFDLYRGDQAGEGRKSLAFRLAFRSADRTLTDADVAAAREGIVSAIAEIGGTLRG